MSRAKHIRFLGTAEGQGNARALLQQLGDASIDHRGVPRALVMRCPDGCGQMLSVNLDPRSGRAWRLYGQGDSLTLYPSVWREDGCEAHFIVWKGHIIWCDGKSTIDWNDQVLIDRVGQVLAAASPRPVNFADVALQLNEIPWEVLWACQSLVRARIAQRRGNAEFYVPSP